MYHAPVPLDVDPQELEPAELADESVGADASSQRLRDAHLHNGQAQTRAPLRALFRAHRRRRRPARRLGDARNDPDRADRRLARPRRLRQLDLLPLRQDRGRRGREPFRRGPAAGPGDRRGGGLAAIWSAFPTYAFATQPHEVQVVIGGAMGAMIMAAIGLASVPGRRLRLDRDDDRGLVLRLLSRQLARSTRPSGLDRRSRRGRHLRSRPAHPLDLRPAPDHRQRPHPGRIGPAAAQGI